MKKQSQKRHYVDRTSTPDGNVQVLAKTPEVGQIWVDNDPRLFGRRKIEILLVEPHRILVRNVAHSSPMAIGRHTSISPDRFKNTSRGYRWESDRD